MKQFLLKQPWRSGLIVTTLISVMAFIASLLWQAGLPQWGFILMFGALWLLTGLFLANDEFNEESGFILARVLDDNVDHVLDRLQKLESRLATLDAPDSTPSADQSGLQASQQNHSNITFCN